MIGWIAGAALTALLLFVVGVGVWEGVKRLAEWVRANRLYKRVHARISPVERERQEKRQAAVDKYQIRTVGKVSKGHAKVLEQQRQGSRAVEREIARQRAEYDAAVERVTQHAELHQEFGAEQMPLVSSPGSRKTSAHESWAKASDRYGDAHKALREAWKPIIRLSGTDCTEGICIFPTRRIQAGASGSTWELAHDHAKGGAYDYVGPAHRECNQAEALARGVSWPGAPALSDILDGVGYSRPYPVVRQPQDGDLIRTFTDKYGGIFEEVWESDNEPDPWGNGPEGLRRVQTFLAGPYDHPENVYRRMDVEGTRTTEGLLPPFY